MFLACDYLVTNFTIHYATGVVYVTRAEHEIVRKKDVLGSIPRLLMVQQ
jgi:hypothetical protein